MNSFIFPFEIYESIRKTVGTFPAETGGILGGSLSDDLISHFHFDEKGRCGPAEYSPDAETINGVLSQWNETGVRFRGAIHSHPPGINCPSRGDEIYARRILDTNPELPNFFVPIVQPSKNGEPFRIHGFIAERTANGVRFTPVPVQICDPVKEISEIPIRHPKHRFTACASNLICKFLRRFDKRIFQRVIDAYDLEFLQQCRVVWIGIGGAAACLDDLTRAGIGEFVLIDPGVVEKCNLATQAYYFSDVGKPKVERLARRLRTINPRVEITECCASLDDIDDKLFEQLACKPFALSQPPRQVVLVAATDDFFVQARINRLALKFGLPSVACQMYQNALAAEVTFTHLDITSSCNRCLLSSRYDAYLNGYKNSVGSAGSPITSTSRLNALTTTIILAILHHKTNHQRWGNLLERIGNRNLIQIRNHPDVEEKLDLPNFREAFHGTSNDQIFCDETIWRPQKPEHPNTGYDRPCPDCGGTGNLAACKGTFADTRLFPI